MINLALHNPYTKEIMTLNISKEGFETDLRNYNYGNVQVMGPYENTTNKTMMLISPKNWASIEYKEVQDEV